MVAPPCAFIGPRSLVFGTRHGHPPLRMAATTASVQFPEVW